MEIPDSGLKEIRRSNQKEIHIVSHREHLRLFLVLDTKVKNKTVKKTIKTVHIRFSRGCSFEQFSQVNAKNDFVATMELIDLKAAQHRQKNVTHILLLVGC